jgi:hypothetical protein
MEAHSDSALLPREQLRIKLHERGYPLSKSYFNKLCLPSVSAGPPVETWWGKRPLYRLDKALVWAKSRCGSSPGKLIAPIPFRVA